MQSKIPPLHPKLANIEPALIIFDKDGTLIDFNALWGGWVIALAKRLEEAAGLSIAPQLFEAMDYDAESGHIVPEGKLAVTPMTGLRDLTYQVLQEASLSETMISEIMAKVWHSPNPLTESQPLTDLSFLFGCLRAHGLKIAVATSDDHAPTEALVIEWGLSPLVDAIAGADDGMAIKPAPDMVLYICDTLKISPDKTVMVGDNVADLQMGRAAGVGLTVGVLSGVSTATDLTGEADMVLSSIKELIKT